MIDWQSLKIVKRPVADLLPYARNARTHSPEQVAEIAQSIRTFGFTNPILIDGDGTIIAGHGRVMALQALKEPNAPVIIAKGWSEDQKRAYVLADNQLALNAGWDYDLLRTELVDLKGVDFDLSVIGFDPKGLESILDGWASNLGDVENHGSHTDGITVAIKVSVKREDAQAAESAIKDALEAAGIGFDL